MKQNFYFKSLLIALFVLFSRGGVFAEEKVETFTFSEMGYSNAQSITAVNGTNVMIEFDKGTNSNDPSYYNTGNAIRVYGGGFFTVTAGGNTITKIVLVFGSGDGDNKITTDVNTYKNGKWSGISESVRFTVGGSSGQRRIASISVTYDFVQGTGTQDPQNSFAYATDNATVGEAYTVQKITTLSSGRKSYESSDETVAAIDNNGNVTLKKAGETIITVTTAADDNYAEGSASYKLIVEKGTPGLSFAQETVTAYLGTEQNGPKLINPGDGAVTYEISDPTIATIQPKGYIQPKSVGTATVTATTAETDAWLPASASYTLKVEEVFSINAVGSYELVKDASTLKDGDQILISYITSSSRRVLGGQKSNNFGTTILNSGAVSEDLSTLKVTTEKNVTAAILEGSTGAWYFHTNGGYLCATSSSSNNLGVKTLSSAGDNAKARISISDGNATIKFLGSNTRNTLKFNSSDLLFSCYDSNNSTGYIIPIQLYRKIDTTIHAESPAFTYDPAEYTITFGDEFKAPELGKAADYDGTVTFASDNAEVAEVDAETGDVTVKGPGTATITATGIATEHFEAATASYMLTVNKQASAVSFAESVVEITYGDNYDKQKATAEGFSGDLVYTSSNESVVKFHGNGVIDVLGPGTVTITATAPATETTEESSATYTLKIYEPADVTEVLNEDFSSCNGTSTSFGGTYGFANVPTNLGWETSYCQAGPQYLKLGDSSNAGVATSPAFSVVGEAPLSFALAPWIANNNTENATVTVSLTNATFENGSSSIELSTKDLVQRGFTTFDQYKIVGNSEAVQITFTSGGSYERFFLDNVVVGGGAQPAHEINLKFSSAGYLTWVATADVDFAQTTGVTAYKITEATPKKITMVEVDKVKKGEAVMLQGSGTVQLTRTTGVDAFTDNKMLACKDGSVTGNGVGGVTNTDVYVLGNGKNGLGFYMLKGTLQAGKGYLRVTEEAGNAKQSFIGFEVVTGVDAIEIKDADDAAIYNLQGIRVAHPQKGIYVKNGKKYVK